MDECFDQYAKCTNRKCTCEQGYKPGLKNDDCISNMKSLRYNQTCFDNVSCYYGLVCWENKCQCYPGWKPVGGYDCAESLSFFFAPPNKFFLRLFLYFHQIGEVGDSCSKDEDCSRAPNTGCFNGKCSCVSGFKRVQYFNDDGSAKQVCISQSSQPATEGNYCNVSVSSNPQVCKPPFVCTACETNRNICARKAFAYGGANQNHFNTFSIAFGIVLVILVNV